MSEWVALSRTKHADKHYVPRQGYAFAAKHQVVPILTAELSRLLPHYALGFIQQGESYQPVALIGLDGERNLYLHPDGRWLASYVPAVLRGYPFTLARSESDKQALCIEQVSLIEDPSAQPLFDTEGKLAKRVQQIVEFLTQRAKNRQVTHAACQALSQAGGIEPWPLQIERGEGQEQLKVQGLHRINEKALNQLEVETFAKLRSHGALALAYAQLFSMAQLPQLGERVRFHEKLHASQQAVQPATENLDVLFEDDINELTFDFDNG